MFLPILLLIAGLGALIVGANLLVDGGSSLASRMKISPMVIGLTVVAFGTSAPEIVVNVISSVKGESGLVFGNVIGSNIFNVLCVLGLTAIVYPISIQRTTARIEVPALVATALLTLIMFGNSHWGAKPHYVISRIEGIILLLLFLLYIGYTLRIARSGQAQETEVKQFSLAKAVIFVLLGVGGLMLGGKLLVDNAVKIAQGLGISERIIALTIISIGTSLPELVTSVVAAFKKNAEIAVGNVVGSCLFNIFAVLGISATIAPVTLGLESAVDAIVNLIATIFLLVFVYLGKGIRIDRGEGTVMFILFLCYITYVVLA